MKRNYFFIRSFSFILIVIGCLALPRPILAQAEKQKQLLLELEKMAEKEKEKKHIREIADIEDQNKLKKIYNKSKSPYIQAAAVCKFSDQSLLDSVVFKFKTDLLVKATAIKLLTNLTLLDSLINLPRVYPELKEAAEQTLKELIYQSKDQTRLAEIATEFKSYAARDAANETLEELIRQIKNQTQLAEIATESKSHAARHAAVIQLEDQELLARIARSDESFNVRLAATRKLNDQELLARIAYSDQISDVRLTAIRKLDDPVCIGRVAIEYKNQYAVEDWDVRKKTDNALDSALIRITDSVLLAKIALESNRESIRLHAINRLKDQTVLSTIAFGGWNESLTTAAIEHLDDQATLRKLAQEDKRMYVRMIAVNKLTDQAVLGKVATTDVSERVRKRAVTKLTDQALLSFIAQNDSSEQVQMESVGHLTDQKELEKIARNDPNANVRLAAATTTGSQGLVVETALQAPYIIDRINDQSVLAAIAVAQAPLDVRVKAAALIDDATTISKVLESDASGELKPALEQQPIHIVGELFRADSSGPVGSNFRVYFLPAFNGNFLPAQRLTHEIRNPKRNRIIDENRDSFGRVFQTIYQPGDTLIGFGYYKIDNFWIMGEYNKIVEFTYLNPSAKTDSQGRFDIELRGSSVASTDTYKLISGQPFAVGYASDLEHILYPIFDVGRKFYAVYEWNGKNRRINVGRIFNKWR